MIKIVLVFLLIFVGIGLISGPAFRRTIGRLLGITRRGP